MRNKILSAVLLASILFATPALSQVTVRQKPGEKLNFELAPGTQINYTLDVINLKNTPIDVELYATDATITETGGFSALGKYAARKNVGKWTTFTEPTFHLEPNEEKTATFTISVPPDITPGSYAGAISVEPALPKTTLKQTGAIVSTRLALPLYVKVSGQKVIDYAWNGFLYNFDGSHKFVLTFENNGNTIIKTDGQIILRNYDGSTESVPVEKILLLQKEKTEIVIPWKGKPFFGFYKATAELNFSEFSLLTDKYVKLGTQTRTLDFTIIPWNAILTILVLIALVIAILIVRKIGKKNYIKKCVPYQVVAGDSLSSIAKKTKVSWHKLITINRLKPPYDLSPGQKILVPPKK